MMRPKPLLICVLVLTLAASSGHAARKPQIVDVRGDANFINDQGPGVTIQPKGPQTPVQYDAVDILTVLANTEYTGAGRLRRPVFVTLTMTLAASPTSDNTPRRYVVMFTSKSCQSAQAYFDWAPRGVPNQVGMSGVASMTLWTPGFRLVGCGSNLSRIIGIPKSKVVGKSIVWRIPFLTVGRLGAVMADLRAETRMRQATGWPYMIVDLARGPIATYKLGT